jgi:hypothetical protein
MKKNKLWLAVILLTSCSATPTNKAQCEMTDYYIGDAAVTPLLSNTCEEAGATPGNVTKEYFSLAQFPVRLTVKQGGARFRSSPEFNSMNLNNVLGFIAEKNEIYAAGTFKNINGIYYTIPVIDVSGAICLAYVSIAVVDKKLEP